MTLLSLENVHVRYPIFQSLRAQSILSSVASRASFGVLGKRQEDITFVHALRGVSVEFSDGDRVGIIGRNGAGKSTMLKTLAGINWPQSGERRVEGRVNSILQMSAGFDFEKTGLENINFVCRLFCMPPADEAAVTESVIEFSELGEFLRMPLRTYSAGMLIRLGFGLATSLPGDILLIDEVIGGGDAFFMERAATRAREIAERARVLILASHSEALLREFCDRAIWMDQGRIVDFGGIDEVHERYLAQTPRYPEGVVLKAGALRDC